MGGTRDNSGISRVKKLTFLRPLLAMRLLNRRSWVTAMVGKRGKYLVLLTWFVIVGAGFSFAGKLTGAEKNDATAWLPGAAESTKALKAESAFLSPNTAVAVVVYERLPRLTVVDRSSIASEPAAFARAVHLGGPVAGPVWSRDGEAAQISVPIDLGPNGWSRAADVVAQVKAIAQTAPGVTVHITGPAGSAAASSDAFKGIDSTLLYAAVAVVVGILLLTYRSPILWLLPVISAGAALTTAQGIVYLLARYAGLVVNAMSAGILTVLVFGAATDYALLLVARYREELRRHEDRHQAMAVALHRAGPAVLASASTVVAGLLCLLAAETNSTRGLGPVAAVGIVIGFAAMVTLLPALLVIAGRWVFWPSKPHFGSPEPTSSGVWARVGRRVSLHPRRVWLGTTVALAVLAVGVVGLQANGLTEKQTFRGTPDSVVGEAVLARHFSAGVGDPVVVIADAAKVGEVQAALRVTPGVAGVAPPTVRSGTAFLQGTLTAAPDSPAAYQTVERVRASVHSVPGANALVGGTTATSLDVQRAAQHDRDIIIPIVLLVLLVILAVLLRALLVPLLLVATVGLSFAAALGVSTVVFSHVFGFGGADSALPLFVFIFLVALGIDYNIFLMTRVREEAQRHGTHRGSLVGLAATGGVITSAGFVLAGTFAVLTTLPLTTFTEIGFAVAFGVLLDTIVVRSILVTALNLDIGDRIWWPSLLGQKRGQYLPEALTGHPVRAAGWADFEPRLVGASQGLEDEETAS
jgi:RND superfamily putative drug exporter